MPDTAILRTSNGWIDRDDPTTTYPVRWQARVARRNRLQFTSPTLIVNTPAPSSGTTITTGSYTVNQGGGTITQMTTLNPLQVRLFERLTIKQGVSKDDALEIITTHGYNASASYGHMRQAGANHAEAKLVIDLGNPGISLTYGLARETQMDHTNALALALTDDGS